MLVAESAGLADHRDEARELVDAVRNARLRSAGRAVRRRATRGDEAQLVAELGGFVHDSRRPPVQRGSVPRRPPCSRLRSTAFRKSRRSRAGAAWIRLGSTVRSALCSRNGEGGSTSSSGSPKGASATKDEQPESDQRQCPADPALECVLTAEVEGDRGRGPVPDGCHS